MSNLQEILLKESGNTDTIYFYREGVFFKAYEHSAYLFVKYVKPFMVKKRFVKSVNQEVVSIGFPTNSLHGYFEKGKIKENENTAEVVINETVDSTTFDEWRKKIELISNTEKKPKQPLSVASHPVVGNQDVIIMKIKTFPIEVKTPLDCMMFLSELKKML